MKTQLRHTKQFWLMGMLIGGISLAGCNGPGLAGDPSKTAAQGNGSSGIGNLVPIVPGLQTSVPTADAIRVDHNLILDGKTGEKLIEIKELPSLDEGSRLFPAKFGQVRGLEYLPQKGSGEANHWLVRLHGGTCYQLTPLSNTNPKVLSVIGALSEP